MFASKCKVMQQSHSVPDVMQANTTIPIAYHYHHYHHRQEIN